MPGVRRSSFALAPSFPAAVFAAVLVSAVVGGDVLSRTVPTMRGPGPTTMAAWRPSGGDHYLANDVSGHLDHHVIYFGTDAEVTARIRTAEVLFLGNSRLLFALRPEELRPFFAAQSVPYYVMGFGYREADRFPLAIIRKFDLHPRLVVVNADGFFGGGLSEWAEVVNRDTPFAARKRQLEGEAAHEARRNIERLVPNWLQVFGLPGLGLRRSFNAYRSRTDGTWEISPWPDGTKAFVAPSLEGRALAPDEVAAAREFMAELDARGSRLVLTHVPTPEPMPGAGPARFAELLGVPLVTAAVPALTTHDESHLSQGSARDWSRAFVAALAPYVRALAGGQTTP